ncbi:MAG TPA: DUF2252 family protein [Ferruginibacter sp.]|jgi:uncharacterized protein (DUF2252 family)|nr:DUF2252 family protein [Ferruginibacter sp.]
MGSVTQKIYEYNKNRNKIFLDIKYQALKESPFRFYRGTCHLFFEHLSQNIPVKDPTKIWICGDLHIENYGTYKGDNGLVYFDMNDFDEAVLGPATWEVLRTMTSIYLASEELKLSSATADELVDCFFTTYLHTILKGKPMAFERDTTKGIIRSFITTVTKRKSKELLEGRLVENGTKKPELRIIKGHTMLVNGEVKKAVTHSVNKWCMENKHKNWEVCDVAYRIAGTGSLGVNRFEILMYYSKIKKYFLLDMKQAVSSSVKPFIKIKQPAWKNEAERVTSIQSYMQNVTPALLGTIIHEKMPYTIKKLQPTQDRMDLQLCNGRTKKFKEVIGAFAEITASAQLRSTGRAGSGTTDELITFYSKAGSWKKDLLKYSKQYAGQVKKDYQSYCKDTSNL